jgi:hypothetical protein
MTRQPFNALLLCAGNSARGIFAGSLLCRLPRMSLARLTDAIGRTRPDETQDRTS